MSAKGPATTSFHGWGSFDARVLLCLADEIRFPFEVEFVNYENIVLQVPMYSPELIEHVMMLANDRWRRIIRAKMKEIFEILTLNVHAEIVHGQQMWAWLWSEYFKACYVATAKRRQRVVDRYLRQYNVSVGVGYAPITCPRSRSFHRWALAT
jgi:hypothetical protein